MILSERTKHYMRISTADNKAANEVINAIESAQEANSSTGVIHTWSAEVTGLDYESVYSAAINPDHMIRVKFSAVAKEVIGNEKAAYEKIAVFYRDGVGAVQILGPSWNDFFTLETNLDFDVGYTLFDDHVEFTVKNAVNALVSWSGYTEIATI